jgi:hypothetical protein
MAQVKKISVATVYGKIALSTLMAAPNKTLDIMTVVGVAVGIDKGESSYGDWECLKGDFEATDAKSGKVVRASTCFLPPVAMDAVKVAMSQAGANRGVEFAIKIIAKYVAEDEGHKAGGSAYEYSFEHLLKPSAENDPILKLKAAIAAQTAAALPAPKPEEPAPEAATPKGKKETAKA